MNRRMDLNGTWKLRCFDGQRGERANRLGRPDADLGRAIDMPVPGEIHERLMELGVLGDINRGLEHFRARWVEEMLWTYRRTFRPPRRAPGERAWLVFDRLDLGATIFLNGVEIGRHANAFYPCRIDVTDRLAAGENVLAVEIDSGVLHARFRSAEGYQSHLDSELTRRVWLRKPQSNHGWDWSPRLLTVGIAGDVYLETARGARWDRLVARAEVSDDLASGRVTARVFAEGLGPKAVRGTLTVTVVEARRTVRVPVEIRPGLNPVEAVVEVPAPRLWWPVGHGAPDRYTVRAALTAGGRVVGTEARRVGFRRVRVNQDPHPEGGRYFVIEINNKPIFCKGGNFVPADLLYARVDRARYATLVDRALEANANLLRVWGGGLYESDHLYDLCDERGILLWQEFVFACAKYPTTDPEFLADVKREATHQVRRLAHHPSLIVWCGNNEMEEGNFHWGYEKGVAHPDYALFHMVLPVILRQEDPGRYYQPSSPYSPDHLSPNQHNAGDQHPWGIGFGNTDFRGYRDMICRFPNEGGILGPTSLPTVRACLGRGAQRPGTLEWESHDNSINYWGPHGATDRMLEQWLGKRLDEMSIEDYVYWAGVVQGEGLAEYIRNFRRRMFSSASAIFWMYNDCWPAVRSWTIVDYYLRRTPAFWPVRRAFAPVAAVVAREGGRVRVYGVNEGPERRLTLRHGLFSLRGRYAIDETADVTLPANASTPIAEFDAARWDRAGLRTHAAFAVLSDGGREVARDRLFLPLFRELKWPPAEVRVRVRGGRAVFECDTFAWRVCLDLDGARAWPDNFFDVFPGIPTVLDWPARRGRPVIRRVGNLV
jgi:beta-mannosidase